jgi:hypothetical protein
MALCVVKGLYPCRHVCYQSREGFFRLRIKDMGLVSLPRMRVMVSSCSMRNVWSWSI